VGIPLTTIFAKKNVHVKVGKIETIDYKNNKVVLKKGEELPYDYLVLALGSETETFNIPGAKENSLTLKSLYDAAILRNKVKMLFENACNDKECQYPLQIVIGGGGFTGTELAGELHKYCSQLVKQFAMPSQMGSFEVTVVQSGDQLLNGLDKDTAIKAKQRLEQLHVKVILGSHITKVDPNQITLENGGTLPFHLLIWTVGVRGNSLLKDSGLTVDKGGRIVVNELLQIPQYPNVFACGDCACFPMDQEGHCAPPVAPIAVDQGKIIAENISGLLRTTNYKLRSYQYHHSGYIVPVSGKFALARLDWIKVDGALGFALQQWQVFKYLKSILPLSKALMRWDTFEMELAEEG